MATTICERCGKEFTYRPKGKLRRFCSIFCSYPNSYAIESKSNCPICGDEFTRIDSNDKNKRKVTCGKQSCQKSRKNHPNYSHKVKIKCSFCLKVFLKTSKQLLQHKNSGFMNHYCSAECQRNAVSTKSRTRAAGGLIECPKCKIVKSPEFFAFRNICKKCLYTAQKERWTARKKWAIQYLGGKCKDCGFSGHWAAFDFHHRDPSTKEYDWNKLKLKSKQAIMNELDKCDLLCACCHRVRHTV